VKKLLLLLTLLILACTTDPENEASIGGTYVYEEATIKIVVSFLPDASCSVRAEAAGQEPVYITGTWNRIDNMLCVDHDCEPIRNVTASGFEWYDAGSWNYWRKL